MQIMISRIVNGNTVRLLKAPDGAFTVAVNGAGFSAGRDAPEAVRAFNSFMNMAATLDPFA